MWIACPFCCRVFAGPGAGAFPISREAGFALSGRADTLCSEAGHGASATRVFRAAEAAALPIDVTGVGKMQRIRWTEFRRRRRSRRRL